MELIEIVGTLLLVSGAIIAVGVVVRFSDTSLLDVHARPLSKFLRIWRGRGNTPEGRRVVLWLRLALWVQALIPASYLTPPAAAVFHAPSYLSLQRQRQTPAKAGGTKPRVLASSATPERS